MGLHDIVRFVANIWNGTAKQLVQLHLTFMIAVTMFDKNFVADLAEKNYFSVNLQSVGCKKYIPNK